MAGVLVYLGVELLEYLRIDDPIGAVPVHGMNGIWGTLSLGLFASGEYGVDRVAYAADNSAPLAGLFYGGGTQVLLAQAIGSAIITVATFVVAMIVMKIVFMRRATCEFRTKAKCTAWTCTSTVSRLIPNTRSLRPDGPEVCRRARAKLAAQCASHPPACGWLPTVWLPLSQKDALGLGWLRPAQVEGFSLAARRPSPTRELMCGDYGTYSPQNMRRIS